MSVPDDFKHIIEALDEYALVQTDRGYMLFHVKSQSHVIIEENSGELFDLMLQRNVKVAESSEELIDHNFVHYAMIEDRVAGGLRRVRVDDCAHYVFSKVDLSEVGNKVTGKLRSRARGISTAERILFIIENLVVNPEKDFRIDLRLTDRDVYIKPRGFNTLTLAKVAELFNSQSIEQLNESRKVYLSTDDLQHLPATEIARTLKSDDFIAVVINDAIRFTMK